jgi:uncharacterized membrane protein
MACGGDQSGVFDQLLHIYAAVLIFGAICTAFTIWLAWRCREGVDPQRHDRCSAEGKE